MHIPIHKCSTCNATVTGVFCRVVLGQRGQNGHSVPVSSSGICMSDQVEGKWRMGWGGACGLVVCDACKFLPVGGNWHGEQTGGAIEDNGLNYTFVEYQQKVGVISTPFNAYFCFFFFLHDIFVVTHFLSISCLIDNGSAAVHSPETGWLKQEEAHLNPSGLCSGPFHCPQSHRQPL